MGNLRRNRGYSWEHHLVERFTRLPDWHCRRLGGSSTGLPDLVAVNNSDSILLAIECKSGYGKYLYVPRDQVERCIAVTKMFSLYSFRDVVFAFKFGARMKKTYHRYLGLDFMDDVIRHLRQLRCRDDGVCEWSLTDNIVQGTLLPYKMPWDKVHNDTSYIPQIYPYGDNA